MHLQDERRLRVDRAHVVVEVHPVGGAHLAQSGAGRFEQVRQPEPVSDLHHLAAGDDDLAAFTAESRGGQRQRRRAVVDDVDVLGVGHRRPEGVQRAAPALAALPGHQVQFDIVGARSQFERSDRGRRQRRPAEVGVQQHSGRVEHGSQRHRRVGQTVEHDVDDALGCQQPLPHLLLGGADPRFDGLAAHPVDRLAQPLVPEHRVGGRDAPARIGLAGLLLGYRGTSLLLALAEADGNRTRLTEILGHVGFEDRGDHQVPIRLR